MRSFKLPPRSPLSFAVGAVVVVVWGACSESSQQGSTTGPGAGSSTSGATTSGAGGNATTGSGGAATVTGTGGGSDGTTTGPAGSGGSAGSSGSGTGGSGAGGSGAGGSGAGGSGAGGSGAGGSGAGGRATGTGGAGGSTSGGGAGGSGGGAGSGAGGSGIGGMGGGGGVSVLQHHKNATRDGLYVDPVFTKAAAARIHMDTRFKATIQGPTFAQPLYFEAGAGGKDIVLAVTSQNRVYALDAATGSTVWEKQVGTPVGQGSLPCGNINPLGIVGTPVIDAASRTLFFDAMTTPDGGGTKKRLIFALSLEDGATRPGWPVDVSATVKAGALAFNSSLQSQRGALALVNGTLYVPYGGHWGDCGNYHGWVVGVPINNPAAPKAFATSAARGGIWGMGGVASDGTSLFVATGNTFDTFGTWGHGEAVLRFSAGPTFGGQSADYFTPSNWLSLDNTDMDIGGSNAIVLDVPGANPSQLVAAFGKSGVGYLINRANLGGVGTGNGTTGEALSSAVVSGGGLIQAAASYRTATATYIAINGHGPSCPAQGNVTAYKITATSPPTFAPGWCTGTNGYGSPMVTTTDGLSEAIVWWVSADGSNRLFAYDGDTGATIFGGGGSGDAMTLVRKWTTPIAAKGRIFVAADSAVYAFTTQ